MKHEALGKFKEASKIYDSLLEKDPLNQAVLRRKCVLARIDKGRRSGLCGERMQSVAMSRS